ncbi:glycoside hydrolase family 3 [Flammeovirga sp. SR4]|uniref:beta-N-acetylhexosaminidase n=2 Tax=Flammeovirga agarivorans TaxID=2726742 RepID=A0A7X8SJW8_9BACT|nr:glycoside hydrolase family 3 [Flammeovirga agarivorans]
MKPEFLKYISDDWVLKTLSSMSLKQKVGQLFQVAAFSNRGEEHKNEILSLIENFHLGGLTFFQGSIDQQIELTKLYQQKSVVPLFINMDAEWGIGMRLSDGLSFPYQMTLGAIQDDQLIYDMGKKIAQQCKALGVSSPLAPVVDVNNNPSNPVINYRSFGENKENVARKGIAYMKGLQSENILDNAKHFPGHGDTATDSHLELPQLNHSNERLHHIELYPFKKLIEEGLSSIMTAHLQIPVWDDADNMPTTVSSKIIKDILTEELQFEGLLITDAMDMQGITNHYKNGEADLKAILAGNHIITNSCDVAAGVQCILDSISSGKLSISLLDDAVTKILAMKRWVGLQNLHTINYSSALHQEDVEAKKLNQKLFDQALTQLGKPLAVDFSKKVAYLNLQIESKTTSTRDNVAHHLKEIKKKKEDILVDGLDTLRVTVFKWKESDSIESLQTTINTLQEFDHIIVSLHGINIKPFNHFDIPAVIRERLFLELPSERITYLHLGNVYGLDEIKGYDRIKSILVTYQDSPYAQKSIMKAFKKELSPIGQLPVSIQHYSTS